MVRRTAVVSLVFIGLIGLLAGSAWAFHQSPRVFGWVETMEANRLLVKTREGTNVSILVNEATKYFHADTSDAKPEELQVGDRVVVKVRRADGAMTALEIRFSASHSRSTEEPGSHGLPESKAP